jgi:hypothetical protein
MPNFEKCPGPIGTRPFSTGNDVIALLCHLEEQNLAYFAEKKV